MCPTNFQNLLIIKNQLKRIIERSIMESLITLTLIVILLTIFYYYLTWNFNYWQKRNVLGPKPIPFLGTFPKSAVFLKNVLYDIDDIYRYDNNLPFDSL